MVVVWNYCKLGLVWYSSYTQNFYSALCLPFYTHTQKKKKTRKNKKKTKKTKKKKTKKKKSEFFIW